MDIRNPEITVTEKGWDPVDSLDQMLSIIQGSINPDQDTSIKAKNYKIKCNGNPSCDRGLGFLRNILKDRCIDYCGHNTDWVEIVNMYPNAYYDTVTLNVVKGKN